MCGINGYQGTFDEGLISIMNRSILHRGPDGQGTYVDGNTAVGHVRLSIIDLSDNSSQPMTSKCSNFVISYNGEIYNFKVLRDLLISKGVLFSSDGDAEVLLQLWAEYGEAALEMLDGIFSFTIFDKRDRSLTIVRDHFGVKPLYYAETTKGFVFSSEIKALLQDPDFPRDIDLNAVACSLSLLWNAGEDTVLSSVKKLRPGSLLRVKNGQIQSTSTYYSFPRYNGALSLADAKLRLSEELKKSVESQLVSDVEVGAFLSGGLDSSLICALAKEKSSEFKKVYSIEIEASENNRDGFVEDLPFAERVADDLGLDLNVVKASSGLCSLLPKCLYYLDEPQGDPAILNTYKICEGARKDGVKVLLSGAGGDDLFTGYRRHYAASLDRRLEIVPMFLRRFSASLIKLVPIRLPFVRRLRKLLFSVNQTGIAKLSSYFKWLEDDVVESLIREELRGNLNVKYVDELFERSLSEGCHNNVESLLELERQFFLVDHNFNYTDKMSMAHGIEVRVPLVNRGLAAVAAGVSTKHKQKAASGKWILKLVAERWLSKKVIYRKKTGFGAPLRSWVHGPLSSLIDSVLSEEAIASRGIFDYDTVRALIESDRCGERDAAYTIYSLLSLEIWFRQFVDPPVPRILSMEELLN